MTLLLPVPLSTQKRLALNREQTAKIDWTLNQDNSYLSQPL